MSAIVPEHHAPRRSVRRLGTGPNPYLPVPARIMRMQELTSEIRLYDLRFTDTALADRWAFRPGQFVELSIMGVGEGPFSLPSSPTRRGIFQLGIRRTGTLTDYLFDRVREGDTVGIRGPLGNGFPIELFEGQDMLLVAGGLGMVPLRGLLHYLIDQRDSFGRVILLYGTRSPDQVLFRDELESLARRGDAEILLSVDTTQGKPWGGRTGVVTELLDLVQLDVSTSYAVACGPPVFYKFMLEKLVARGFGRHRIYLSLERRMECGIGKCGHCAVGYTFTCLHGPVFSYWDAVNLPELIYT
ncbi:MAG: oxidoreductase FAD/NAD(P)-binding protein [Acidobacteria bacterium]|jgi:NAD(P)H-flavin reductase|nr:oxidoreductase FAD/NAD(P)-binding protein [Acidobacteriota bacterium]